MAKWVDEGENRVADILFGALAVDANLYLGLYENSTEPAENAMMTGITEQATGALNYNRIALARGTWSITTDYAQYAQQTFTATGGAWGDQYGYFINTASTGTAGKLLCVEHFSNGPYNVQDGGSVKITPKITVG